MKLLLQLLHHLLLLSLPVRGAWVEIFPCCDFSVKNSSLPVRGAWVEILMMS